MTPLSQVGAVATRSARHSRRFGPATASKGVVGGSQQFDQRPSAGGNARVGEF